MDQPPIPGRTRRAVWVVAVPTILVWLPALPLAFEPGGSDAAGNGIAEGLGTLALILVWCGAGLMLLITLFGARLSAAGMAGTVLLVPAACAAGFACFWMEYEPFCPAGPWPAVIATAGPPLAIFLALWASFDPARRQPEERIALPVVFGLLGLLSVGAMDLLYHQDLALRADQAAQDAWEARLARFGPDTPLPDWIALWKDAGFSGFQSDRVLEGIRALPRRQADAEAMLDRDALQFNEIGYFDLRATPAFCQKARASLRRTAAALAAGPARPPDQLRPRVEAATAGFRWLAHQGCLASPEAGIWADAAAGRAPAAFAAQDETLAGLRRLADPAETQRLLDDDPANADLLTERSSLRAWLKFINDPRLHDQILAKVQTLDHRTADLIGMLRDKNGSGSQDWPLSLIPDIGPDPTPDLCQAALSVVDDQMPMIFRPTDANPARVEDMLQGIGGRTIPPLIWLAEHHCDTGQRIGEATALVRLYQDTPGRAALLARLAELPQGS